MLQPVNLDVVAAAGHLLGLLGLRMRLFIIVDTNEVSEAILEPTFGACLVKGFSKF